MFYLTIYFMTKRGTWRHKWLDQSVLNVLVCFLIGEFLLFFSTILHTVLSLSNYYSIFKAEKGKAVSHHREGIYIYIYIYLLNSILAFTVVIHWMEALTFSSNWFWGSGFKSPCSQFFVATGARLLVTIIFIFIFFYF